MRAVLCLLALLATSSALAAPLDPAALKVLTDQAAASDITSRNTAGAEYHSLERFSSPDPTVTRQADYFSVVGNTQTDGTFHRDHLEIVAESWTVDAKNIRSADQWGFALKLDGTITFVMHQKFSEDTDGTILSEEKLDVPSDLTAPELVAQLAAKVAEWSQATTAK